jgi:hypothetical protein
MARGWESKSVEEQQSLDGKANAVGVPHRQSAAEDARRVRQIQDLKLQRERILSQRTSSPARRAALEAALGEIEARIAQLS